MWILFGLISAIILATRKVQEKRLVDIFGQSLGWMLRSGSAIIIVFIWVIFSRDTTGIDHPTVWIVVAIIALIMYPLQTYGYYICMSRMPLSVFGLLAPVAFISSAFFSGVFLGSWPTLFGMLGIGCVSVGAMLLIPRKKGEKQKHIPYKIFFLAIFIYSIMGLGSVMDKIAMQHTSVLLYATLNQSLSAIVLIMLAYFFYRNMGVKYIKQESTSILSLGTMTALAWLSGITAIQLTSNVGYAVALINMHALFTALYGIAVLGEGVTRDKLLAFLSMMLALICFAFA